MGAVWLRARAELRQRWRATVVLTVLVGLVGGAVLAAAAGARRTASAFERFLDASLAADAIVKVEKNPDLLAAIEQLPQVAVAGPHAYLLVRPAGTDLEPALEFAALASVDGRLGEDLERPRVIKGRPPDPVRLEEVAVNEDLADDLDLAVGDQLSFEWLTPAQLDEIFGGGDPGPLAGPTEPLTVVAIERSPTDLVQTNLFNSPVSVTPAFYRTYADRMAAYDGITAVRLHRGNADLPAFTAAVEDLSGDDPNVLVKPAADTTAKVADAVSVLAGGLWLFAAVAGVAGSVVIALLLGRQLTVTATERRVLATLGMTRLERTGSAVLVAVPLALSGGAAAVGIAACLSPLLPVGVARSAEPDPGFSFDGAVLAGGGTLLIVAVLVLGMAAAWWGERPVRRGSGAPGGVASRPSATGGFLARAGLSPMAVSGARLALDGTRGGTPRPIVAAAVVGVAGMVTAATFGASLLALGETPGNYGWNWDLSLPGLTRDGDAGLASELLADPEISDAALVHNSFAVIGGSTTLTFGLEQLKGSVSYTVVAGRAPASADEVVLGTETLRRLQLDVGDAIDAQGSDGVRRLGIVGRAAFPSSDQDTLAVGAGLTSSGYHLLETSDGFTDMVLRWAPGVEAAAAAQRVEEQTGRTAFALVEPAQVQNLQRVAGLPPVLAALLALLGASAVGYALMNGAGRRRRDLAVLRALGFVRGQVAATLTWQASVLAVVALVAGIPLGLALGRWAWSVVAARLGVVVAPVVPALALGGTALMTMVVANALAVVPARRAARISLAVALRAE